MQDASGIDAGGALEGVLLIELAQTLAGEFAGGLLADMGATVVKIEPPEGSPIRGRGPGLPGEDSLYFQSENRGKRSVVADLASLASQSWFTELLSAAEGVIEDLGPGRLEEVALAPSELQRVNPRLSILRLSAFGQTGPLSSERGDDRTAQAFSGGQFATGFTDRPPQPIHRPDGGLLERRPRRQRAAGGNPERAAVEHRGRCRPGLVRDDAADAGHEHHQLRPHGRGHEPAGKLRSGRRAREHLRDGGRRVRSALRGR